MDKGQVAGAAETLSGALHADVKAWLTRLGRFVSRSYQAATRMRYDSPAELLHALAAGQLRDGAVVELRCKPAGFGPFLRTHFLSPTIRLNAELQLGPRILHPDRFMGMMAQSMTQLMPVGLYPAVGADVNQACLYAADAEACGFVGLSPGINELVPHVPALLASRHSLSYGKPCRLTGAVRLIDAACLAEAGYGPEVWEEVRQAGAVWFFDATGDDSELVPLADGVAAELWGGLYGSGHIEIASGELPVDAVVQAVGKAVHDAGFRPYILPSQAGRKEIGIYATGCRALVDSQAPFFSLHMDAELSLGFATARGTFDAMCQAALANIRQVCLDHSAETTNAMDLDFTYTDATNAYSVLKSLAADEIRDPVAIAIRDWHRTRGA